MLPGPCILFGEILGNDGEHDLNMTVVCAVADDEVNELGFARR